MTPKWMLRITFIFNLRFLLYTSSRCEKSYSYILIDSCWKHANSLILPGIYEIFKVFVWKMLISSWFKLYEQLDLLLIKGTLFCVTGWTWWQSTNFKLLPMYSSHMQKWCPSSGSWFLRDQVFMYPEARSSCIQKPGEERLLKKQPVVTHHEVI